MNFDIRLLDKNELLERLGAQCYDVLPLPKLEYTREKMEKFKKFVTDNHIAELDFIEPGVNRFTFTPYTEYFESWEALLHLLKNYFELEPMCLEVEMLYYISARDECANVVGQRRNTITHTVDGLYSEVLRNKLRVRHEDVIKRSSQLLLLT